MALAIAVQTTAANSADIVVSTAPVTITLVPPTGVPLNVDGNVHYSIDLQKKDTLGNYYTIATITNRMGGIVWYGSGTYRISKKASTFAFGVDQDWCFLGNYTLPYLRPFLGLYTICGPSQRETLPLLPKICSSADSKAHGTTQATLARCFRMTQGIL